MNKAVTVEEYLKGISLLKKYRIMTHGNFIIGFPGETEKTVQDTIEFIKDSGIDFYRAQLWYCMPITPIWESRQKYGIEGKSFEWSHATMNSQTACDIIDEMFLSIDRPVWTPQYNFDINNIIHMLHGGITLEQVKRFLEAFNNGIREKLRSPLQEDISPKVVEQLRQAL
jgi:anaerobic magnesium-protoporphyrin IX monomethyl ester cyclase